MIKDYITELVRRLREAHKKAKSGDEFEAGRKAGLYQALSLLMDQITIFEIRPAYLGIENVRLDDFV
jgi:hypothetical protein